MTVSIYFHGVPGAPAELGLAPGLGPAADTLAPDRLSDRPDLPAGAYFDDLAARLRLETPPGGTHIIAFSLGAAAALQVAARLGPHIAHIDLIAPAAPLELGDFLPAMSGRQVFALARTKPMFFNALSQAQMILARSRPEALYRLIFAEVRGPDAILAADPDFRAAMTAILAQCFIKGSAGYRREMLAYAQPWAGILPRVTAPTRIWHGSADTWAPFAMAEALARSLPRFTACHRLDDLGHFSALHHALPIIRSER